MEKYCFRSPGGGQPKFPDEDRSEELSGEGRWYDGGVFTRSQFL